MSDIRAMMEAARRQRGYQQLQALGAGLLHHDPTKPSTFWGNLSRAGAASAAVPRGNPIAQAMMGAQLQATQRREEEAARRSAALEQARGRYQPKVLPGTTFIRPDGSEETVPDKTLSPGPYDEIGRIDPLLAMQMEAKQRGAERLAGMKDTRPAMQKNYDYAVKSGQFKGSFADWMRETRATIRDVGNTGDVERKKLQVRRDEERKTNFPRVKAAMSDLKASRKQVIGKIDEALGDVSNWTAGLMSVASIVPGTPQADLANTLQTIKANLGLDSLQQMKDSSVTGGSGLGQLSARELTSLESKITSVEQSQSPKQLRKNLKELRDFLVKAQGRREQAFESEYGKYGSVDSYEPDTSGFSVKRIK